MAPIKAPRTKSSSSRGSKNVKKSSALGSNTKSRVSKKPGPIAPVPKQQKTKSNTGPVKKKKRVYTDKELGIPKLNMVTPVGVDLPKGKKKGKVFVDDQESMMTILAIVNASKEGQIESKMMKSREMEEIREARRKEAEARQQQRTSKLENIKDNIRQKRRRKSEIGTIEAPPIDHSEAVKGTRVSRKRVSFA